MNYIFINRPALSDDIINAVEYYKTINPKLAKQFLFRIREVKSYIIKSPVSFQIKYKQVRTIQLKQFPYHIHYLVDEENLKIIILAVIDAYKNPADYLSR